MKITFDKIGCTGRKNGICPKCGKKASRTKMFWQTMTRFNLNKKGLIKTRREIHEECIEEMMVWKQEPVYHAKCEI